MARKATKSRKYGKTAQKEVEKEMKSFKKGKAHSGRKLKKVTNPKQAIAIGLSKARKKGAKVPAVPSEMGTSKTKRKTRKSTVKQKSATTAVKKKAPSKAKKTTKVSKAKSSRKSPAKKTAVTKRKATTRKKKAK